MQELHFPDSCPKISFGKMMTTDDGTNNGYVNTCTSRLNWWLQLGQFVDYFQEIMNQ
jgi:chloramphenicol O-acetyltransferase type A